MKSISKRVISLLLSGPMAATAFAAVPTVAYADETTTGGYAELVDNGDDTYNLNFAYGEYTPSGTCWDYGETITDGNIPYPVWHDYASKVVTVNIDESFNQVQPTTFNAWFENMNNIDSITGIEYLDTSKTTSMTLMFAGASSLETLDLSTFNTKNVDYYNGMFADCTSLKALNLSNFNVEEALGFAEMFAYCENLEKIYVDSKYNTDYWDHNFTEDFDDEDMFYGAVKIEGYNEGNVGLTMAKVTGGYFSLKTNEMSEQNQNLKPAGVSLILDGKMSLVFSYENLGTVDGIKLEIYTGTNLRKAFYVDSKSELRNENSISCPITATQFFNGQIYLKPYITDEYGFYTYGNTKVMSINSYVNAINRGENIPNVTKDLVNAVQDYSQAAEKYTGEYSGDLNIDDEIDEYIKNYSDTDSDSDSHDNQGENVNGSSDFTNSCLVLDDDLNIRLYCASDIQNATAEGEYEVDSSNDGYIEIKNIPAYAVGHKFVVNYSYSNGTGTGSVSYAPMDYIQSVINGPKPKNITEDQYINLKTLVRTLFLYGVAAEKYVKIYGTEE